MSIIVVSGHRRTGSSMMMNALYDGMNEGGVLFAPEFEELNPQIGDYKPNPNGLWEVGFRQYMNAQFLRDMPDGAIVKIMSDGLPNLPNGQYVVIYMHRDIHEMNLSIETADKHLRAYAKQTGRIRRSQEAVDDKTELLPFCVFRDWNLDDEEHILGIMDARKDIDLIEVNYADVIADPEKAFKRIKWTPLGRQRMNLDIRKAAAVIDPKLWRVKNVNRSGRIQRTSTKGIDTASAA